MNSLSNFLYGMKLDYLQVWREYPATIVWTAIISFILGAVFL